MAFHTFLHTSNLKINTFNLLVLTLQPHPADTCCYIQSPPRKLCFILDLSRLFLLYAFKLYKCSLLFFSLIRVIASFCFWCLNFWCASEKRERSQKEMEEEEVGGSKSAKPEAGRALMECLRAGEGKAVIRIWMERQERGRGEGEKTRGEEKGGLWLNYSPHHGRRRGGLSLSMGRHEGMKDAADTLRTPEAPGPPVWLWKTQRAKKTHSYTSTSQLFQSERCTNVIWSLSIKRSEHPSSSSFSCYLLIKTSWNTTGAASSGFPHYHTLSAQMCEKTPFVCVCVLVASRLQFKEET